MKYTSPQGLLTDDFVLALEMRTLAYVRAMNSRDRAAAFRRWRDTLRNFADMRGEFAPREFPRRAAVAVFNSGKAAVRSSAKPC